MFFVKTKRQYLAACLVFMIVIAALLPAGTAFAARTVRVGYYETVNFQEGMTEDSVKRGYAYDYLQTIANYTGWKYEYVYGDAGALFAMLRSGEIDMMAGLSMAQGGEDVLFPDLPMGTETYTLYEKSDANTVLKDGVRIASIENSARSEQLKQWAQNKGIEPEIREYETRAVMDAALKAGWVDAAVEADTDITVGTDFKAVERIGSADYYLCVAKGREDLLALLNKAQSDLNDKQPGYISQLETRYYGRSADKALMTDEEKNYISEHRQLNIGYISGYMPFSGISKDGMRSGIIDEIMTEIFDALSLNKSVTPIYTAYHSVDKLIEDLLSGKLDLIFPLQKSNWHADRSGISETYVAVSASMVMVYNSESNVTDAGLIVIEENDPAARTYAELYYPDAKLITAADAESALAQVREGKAEAALLNSVRSSTYITRNGNADFKIVILKDSAELCFGVRRGDSALLTLMDRGISLLDTARLQEKMLQYSETQELSIGEFLSQHMLAAVLTALAVVLAVFVAFYVNYRKLKIKNRELNKANFARAAAEQETLRMLHSLEFDDLTKFYTRSAFYEHARKCFERDPEGRYDLWMSDIANFKNVNGIYGAKAGDNLLVYIANRLKAFRPKAIYGRYGGDRFCVLLPHDADTDPDGIEVFIKDIERGAPIQGVAIKLGVYRDVDIKLPIQRICDRAIIAAKSIKQNFGMCVAEFDDPKIALMQRNNMMEAAFEDALKNSEFEVWYQPKYDPVSDRPVGAEALVRWRRGDNMIPPSEFIPLFETDGLITKLDQYVFERTCADMRRHLDMGRRPIPVSVNLSRASLYTPDLAAKYSAIMSEYAIDIKMIAVELTESAAVGDAGIRGLTDNLIRVGFALHMDDFGSGYSSLASLNVLPFTAVKLDKTLIDCIGEGGGDELLRHVIEMCHFKGMPVVAEGVECKLQVDFLKSLKCDMIQGYYYSRPVNYAAYTEILEKNR